MNKGIIECSNCSIKIGSSFNKYGAKKTELNGKIYDSKFEASVASWLETRKRANDLIDYETQFTAVAEVYNKHGDKIITKKHKIDFRVQELDGSYTLIEAKGVVTSDYRWRRDIVVGIFLSENKDHAYEVVKQGAIRYN